MEENQRVSLKSFLGTLLVLVVFVVILLVWQEWSKPKDSNAQFSSLNRMGNQSFPRVKTINLDGNEVDTSKFYGKLLIVNFWASWCEPCVAEVPSLISLTKAFDGKLKVVAISADDSREDVDAFLTSFPDFKNKNISIVWDGTHALMSQFNVDRLPESFVVDKQGKLVKHITGSINWHTPESEAFVHQLLEN